LLLALSLLAAPIASGASTGSRAVIDHEIPDAASEAVRVLRSALSSNDARSIGEALSEDAEYALLDAEGIKVLGRGRSAVAQALAAATGAQEGQGVALRPVQEFVVEHVVIAAETLPRVSGAPARISLYVADSGRIKRIYVMPAVAATTAAALDRVLEYRRAWSSGNWARTSAFHSPRIRFLRLARLRFVDEKSPNDQKQCYLAGFERLESLQTGPEFNLNVSGCDGGPLEVLSALGVGPYSATLELRRWATPLSPPTKQLFLYMSSDSGIERVIHVWQP
jgi:hypothetical protein